MNKNDLGKAIHDIHGGMSYADALKIVDRILDIIKQRLVRGEKVVISGFGCFRVVARKGPKRCQSPNRGFHHNPGQEGGYLPALQISEVALIIMQFVAEKLYYRIGEVCEIVGVEPHVLRYWETEFPSLAPPKNKAGQRTYRPKDIELLLTIRKLLYEEGFTIAGARKQLSRGTRGGQVPSPFDRPDSGRYGAEAGSGGSRSEAEPGPGGA